MPLGPVFMVLYQNVHFFPPHFQIRFDTGWRLFSVPFPHKFIWSTLHSGGQGMLMCLCCRWGRAVQIMCYVCSMSGTWGDFWETYSIHLFVLGLKKACACMCTMASLISVSCGQSVIRQRSSLPALMGVQIKSRRDGGVLLQVRWEDEIWSSRAWVIDPWI